ncbi:Neuropilin-1a [Eumeta japonica]|uniref:Neuropilin-1a n=1 Tax=Eumeta variegata TaxID=151549 RepID=A0A4C1TZP5_EUMVA|nr:Neuropilin-1a [Eumeta japonica]
MLQVCEGLSMHLSSIHSSEEEHFIVNGIRQSGDYSAGAVYWLGGRLSGRAPDRLSWTDRSPMAYQRWSPRNVSLADSNEDMCLGVQWKSSPIPSQPSGFFWSIHKCVTTGGYVCKRKLVSERVVRNQTVEGAGGRLTSPNYPATYDNDLDYWVNIVGTEGTRLVFVFEAMDLEYQINCLYDFIENQDRDRNRNKKRSKLKAEPESKAGSESEPAQVESGSGTRAIATDPSVWICPLRQFARAPRATRDNAAVACGRADQACYTQFLFRFNKMRCELFRQLRDEGSGERYCGVTRARWVAAGRAASLHFRSDYDTQGAGFSLKWRAVELTGCPSQTYTSKEGVIQSPNYPEFLLPNLECVFNILAPTGFSLRGEGDKKTNVLTNVLSTHPRAWGVSDSHGPKKPPKRPVGWPLSVVPINWNFEDFICRGRSAWDAVGA